MFASASSFCWVFFHPRTLKWPNNAKQIVNAVEQNKSMETSEKSAIGIRRLDLMSNFSENFNMVELTDLIIQRLAASN